VNHLFGNRKKMFRRWKFVPLDYEIRRYLVHSPDNLALHIQIMFEGVGDSDGVSGAERDCYYAVANLIAWRTCNEPEISFIYSNKLRVLNRESLIAERLERFVPQQPG